MRYPQTWTTEKEYSVHVGFSLRFPEGYLYKQTLEEGWRARWLKCDNNNQDQDISQNVNNSHVRSPKFP